MFWILGLALTLILAVIILAPTLRGHRRMSEHPAAYDLRVYRDQLREVDRDVDRGVLQAEDAKRLRAEIGRKVLDADRRLTRAAPDQGGAGGALMRLAPTVTLIAILAGAVALYFRQGVPGAPDMPLAERIAAAQQAYESRPSQVQAETGAPSRPAPDLTELDPAYLSLVEQLREAVARHPDDRQGLALLATHEARLGNLSAARQAAERLVAVQGEDVDPEDLIRLASLMIEAADGIITPQSEALLVRALRIDPDLPQARYLLGVLQIQNGRPDRAFPLWRRLLEEGPADAPWIPSIRATIEDLAWLAAEIGYVPPEAPVAALPQPDDAALEAAGDLDEAERQQMVEGMVAGLQNRLASEGGTPAEWARLINALSVLGRQAAARAIWDEAQVRFAGNTDALELLAQAAASAGLLQ
ncbi:MAG: c-type cytochrome biogenesis protein CcmI [Paracoccus sp. (in: a-proteobacteria)]|nr:c-type cytochrome biogenesis protein CcmI [Paracoccus sp. (in: a-proteobacteria)]